MVTAEAALVLPLISLVALALVWLVSVAIMQVRAVDGARDAARAVARGEDDPVAVELARRAATSDAVVDVSRTARYVTVTVSVDVGVPDWLLVPVPAVTVDAHSTVEVEGDR